MRHKGSFIKIVATIVFLIMISQFSSCSSLQKTNVNNATIADKQLNNSKNPTPEIKPKNVGEENFEKEQRNKFEEVASVLERNRRLWQESNISNYKFLSSQVDGGNSACGEVVIQVRDNKTFFIVPAFKSQIGVKTDCYKKFDTVDKIFSYIRQELDNGRQINVKYNEKFSYPEKINIAYSYDTDDWTSLVIIGFEAVR